MGQLLPTLEADGKQQVERNELGRGSRNFQVAFQQRGHNAQHKKQERGVGKVVD